MSRRNRMALGSRGWSIRPTALLPALVLLLPGPPGLTAGPFEVERHFPGGSITGVIVREGDDHPLAGADVRVLETGTVVSTDGQGRFAVPVPSAGAFTLEVRSEGYVPQERVVEATPDVPRRALVIELVELPHFLSQVVVTPSLYTLYGSQPEVATSLSREDVARLPHLAQDVFRAARWLPGTSGDDYSAPINVRGGEVDETLVLVDGLEIQDPFHLQEVFGGLQSVVDAEVVDDLEFMSGGFPVEFGNRMSGVIDISSTSSGPTRTTAGASTTHLGVRSTGPFAGARGRWLLSVRRTNLDNVIRWVDPDSGLEPLFYDALAKLSYTLGDHTVLSLHALGSWDRTHYLEESVEGGEPTFEEMDSTSSGRYAWLNLKNAPGAGLLIETVLSAGRLERDVWGSIDDWSQTGSVDDERSADIFGLKQDWRLDFADRHLLKWGFELRRVRGSYDHRSSTTIRDPLFLSEPRAPTESRDDSLRPRGDVFAAYAADRTRLAGTLVAEAGLRWDRQTHMNDAQLSPRLNLSYELGDHTTLRGAWGLYHQAQHVDELQVSDGLTEFQPAQRSEHRLLSLQHGLPGGLALRVDLYQKRLTHVWERYENVLNPIEIFPELESDRIPVAPDRAEARGIEIVLRRDAPRWSGWLSYAYARIRDEIDGEWVPRMRDQPHTASFSLNYRPGEKWNLNLAGVYHTGWPATAVLATTAPGPDGGVKLSPYLGPRNRERYPGYLRLDLRASRVFDRGPGTWTVFVEVMNLLNRENQRGLRRIVDYEVDADGIARGVPSYRAGLPLLPSLGVHWTF